MPNISEELKTATEILQSGEVIEPRREAASLLAFALQKNKTFLVAHSEYELSAIEEKRFRGLLLRRAEREPFQYITGKQEFYALDFLVTPNVLIPRPETEIIVEKAIEILNEIESPRFCEIGVGSGCISVSILHAIRAASATGLDISEKALEIARTNAERHGVLPRLELKISDVFANPPIERFDLIVSNPPYISAADVKNLQAEVRDFEPLAALTDCADGLTIIEKIIEGAPEFLKPGSLLLLEIGFNQAEIVREMFSPEIWQKVEFLPDLQNILRTVKAQTGN
ncbi:MAG TPA: peptide chain release factor N(5)-glutamine methyltransferase [Pyrinomonadaceae bacterium]|nr:peptide chain release factor N(5)-glutamine methyltransferase [Pyrinomonadaceae bacterium]